LLEQQDEAKKEPAAAARRAAIFTSFMVVAWLAVENGRSPIGANSNGPEVPCKLKVGVSKARKAL
jgi:hypothetical protein